MRRVAFLTQALMLAPLMAAAPALAATTAPWHDITPKPGLAGWHKAGGNADYIVENGELVGRAASGSANSWLVSDAQYRDFIVEFDAKTGATLNSGMMIRGQSRPDYRHGVVFGYQSEIDPSKRAWSAGIYDEQRRQWLYSLADNEAARRAFHSGEWNHYRVEAIGDRLRTFINGVPAADIVDDTDARGFLAFQVHAVSDATASKQPEVRFRNLRIITDAAKRYASPPTRLEQQGWLANRLSDAERSAGWKLLWDGKTNAGWKSAKTQAFPQKGWSIHDGILSADGAGGGDIVTARDYRNFELSVDFRLAPGSNSGIKYLLNPALTVDKIPSIGLEYQLLDDARHPDAKMGRDGDRTLGSLYDLIPAKNLSDPDSPGKRVNPPGEWNRAVIIVRGKHVEHWLNGFKVVEYERGSADFRSFVAQSKFAGLPTFGEADEGPILLQDHGDKVDFRSIKIREF